MMFFLFALTSDGQGFSFAAVFDGHAGLSSVKFLRFVKTTIYCHQSLLRKIKSNCVEFKPQYLKKSKQKK